jgi:hypothetical protein
LVLQPITNNIITTIKKIIFFIATFVKCTAKFLPKKRLT